MQIDAVRVITNIAHVLFNAVEGCQNWMNLGCWNFLLGPWRCGSNSETSVKRDTPNGDKQQPNPLPGFFKYQVRGYLLQKGPKVA